jgi:hypothetical protein
MTGLMDGIRAIDWWGTISLLAATLMLLLDLDFGGETFAWSSAKVVCLVIFGGVTVFVFVFSETRLARYPVMPLYIFKQRTNVTTIMVTLCQGIVSLSLSSSHSNDGRFLWVASITCLCISNLLMAQPPLMSGFVHHPPYPCGSLLWYFLWHHYSSV